MARSFVDFPRGSTRSEHPRPGHGRLVSKREKAESRLFSWRRSWSRASLRSYFFFSSNSSAKPGKLWLSGLVLKEPRSENVDSEQFFCKKSGFFSQFSGRIRTDTLLRFRRIDFTTKKTKNINFPLSNAATKCEHSEENLFSRCESTPRLSSRIVVFFHN